MGEAGTDGLAAGETGRLRCRYCLALVVTLHRMPTLHSVFRACINPACPRSGPALLRRLRRMDECVLSDNLMDVLSEGGLLSGN